MEYNRVTSTQTNTSSNTSSNTLSNIPHNTVANKITKETCKFKETCNFLIRSTTLPDIYEMYCLSTNNIYEKYGYACVADIKTSIFMNNIMPTKNDDEILELDISELIKKGEVLYFECSYNKIFKKWIPFKLSNYADNINTINQVQITLDNI
jgi:hypothetical protein